MSAARSVRVRAIGLLVVIATAISSVGVAQVAQATAVDSGIAELRQTLDDVGAWTSRLAGAGKLAQQIPTVGRSAGSVLGFPDLVQKAVADKLDGVEHWDDLDGNRTVDLGDGRTGTLTVGTDLEADTKRIDVTLEVARTLTSEPFAFASDSPRVNLSASGGMTVGGSARIAFSVVAERTAGGDTPDLLDDKWFPYVVRDGATTPSIAVDVFADLPTGSPGLAASIGILGVTATETAGDAAGAHDVELHLVGSVTDPDGDGRLYVTRPNGAAGELKDLAAAAGLFDVGFRSAAAGGAGSVHIGLSLTATADASFSLPGVAATVTIDWNDISTGQPTVVANGLDPIDAFLRLSPRDLADMLGQLASAISGSQRNPAKNLNLPFLSGTLADAVKAAEALVDFLEKNVEQPPADGQDSTVDPARIGEPKFRSIQELVKKLEDYSGEGKLAGANIAVNVGTYANDRLPIDLTLTRAATNIDLVEAKLAVAGSGTYGAAALTDNSKTFGPELVGRRVIAGSSGGTVASISADKHTLTLTSPWTGGQPVNATSYSVSGAEVDAGTVNLGNLLAKGGKAIKNANAIQPTAKVSPSYTAQIKFALDLSAPRTGAACNGVAPADPATVACPYEVSNADGSKTVITEEPLPVERLLIGTGYDVLTADFPITTGIDVHAKAGFLAVKIGGSVKVCATGANADCTNPTEGAPMIKVTLNSITGDPTGGYVPVADFFKSFVSNPGARLTVDTNVRGYAAGSVSVPGSEQFLPETATAGFTATWADIGAPAPGDKPTVQVDDLSELLDFDIDPNDPQALLGVVLRVLQLLDEQLQADGGDGVLTQKIPLVDRSLRDFLGGDESGGGLTVTYGTASFDPPGPAAASDHTTLTDTSRVDGRKFPTTLVGRSILIGTQVGVIVAVQEDGKKLVTTKLGSQPANATPYFLRSELADAVTLLTATPPDTLQKLVEMLDDRLGGNDVKFRYKVIDQKPYLVVDVEWNRKFSTSTPVRFNLGSDTIAGAQGGATAEVTVGADLDVDLAVPLSLPAGGLSNAPLNLLGTSKVTVEANASVAGDVQANLGPLSVSLGNPKSSVDAKAKARYSLGFQSAAQPDQLRTLNQFLTDIEPVVNGYAGEVDCGEKDDPDTDPLALCADLPIFISTNGTTYAPLFPDAGDPTKPDPAKGGIEVRLPKTAPTIAEMFALTGNVSGADARPRVQAPSPADLAAAFQAALLDFGLIGDGIDAFLDLVEQSLNSAAMEGKLPVVGQDLQAGADFVGDLREKLDALFTELEGQNGGKLPDVNAINNYLDTKFKQALKDAGADPENFSLDITCKLQPANVTAATAKLPDNETGDTSYEYAVAAVGTSGSGKVDTMIGATKTASNKGTLDATHHNTVTWADVSNAVEYKVLRNKAGGGWHVIATVGGSTNSYKDESAAAGTAYDTADQIALVDSCAGVQIHGIEGVVLRVDIGRGTDVNGSVGCSDPNGMSADDLAKKGCISNEIPLNIGVPGLGVRPAKDGTGGGLGAKVGWGMHLAFELNKEHGFSILTKDANGTGNKPLPELAVGLQVDVNTAIEAELAFLKVNLSKSAGATKPAFVAAFAVDLKSGSGETSCYTGDEGAAACTADGSKRLGFAELAAAESYSDLVAPRLDLHLNVDWLLKATADAAFPGIQARLLMTWNKVITTNSVADAALNSDFQVQFTDIKIDAGKFLTEILGPIVQEIKKVTGPVQPVIDTLYAPIPVLSDLSQLAGGPPVTLVTLAKTFSTLADGPDLTFVDTVAKVITFVNNLPTPSETGDALLIPIGDFKIDGADAMNVQVTPDTGRKLIKAKNYKKKNADGTYSNTSNESEAKPKEDIDSKSNKPALTKPDASGKPVATGAGFTFPLLDNPGLIFNLIMGSDVDIVTFDSGDLGLAFTWRQAFGPVYAPPPVFITMSGSASVTARIQAGFDTYGLRKVFEEGLTGSTAVGILNGLYFKSTDDDGKPLPVVTLYGEIAAGAAVSAVIITVGIEGGVSLTINLAWNDPNGDGKFRLFEFGQVALNNPICLFQMSGRIGLFLRVYITLGISPFSVSFDFTLADITLLDFSVQPDCDPPPPRLGGVTDKTLVVFAGKFGNGSVRGHSAWSNTGDGYKEDVVKVTQLHKYTKNEDGSTTVAKSGVKVDMLGITETWEGDYDRVVIDGRGYGRPMKVTLLGDGDQSKVSKAAEVVPTGGFTMEAVVLGGDVDDTIKSGNGRSLIAGGTGNDSISASDQPASGRVTYLAGGGGDDAVTSGNANAIAAGDSDLTGGNGYETFSSTEVTHADGSKQTLGDVVDWTKLAAPRATEAGSDGKDRVAVGLGVNTSYGNGRDDSVGVAADSELAKTRPAAEQAQWKAKANTIVLGSGSDVAKGGSAADTIWTGAHTAQTRADADVDGTGGADSGVRNTVDTGTGNDTVFGSTIPDNVTGGSKATEKDVFTGGSGNDALLGGFGTDELFGGPGEDWVVAEPAQLGEAGASGTFGVARSYTKTPLPTGAVPSSKLLVGGDGADHVVGGDGGARIFGDRYEATDCLSGAAAGEPASTPPGEPTAGTAGRDLILGGTGVDKVKAGGEADRVEAYAGDDLLCGQDGDDEIYAAAGADKVWAGSGKDRAYGDDGADNVFGNAGNDQLFGGGGADDIEGNADSDTVYGGAANDTILGGTRAAALADEGDTLYGDVGADRIIGDNGDGMWPHDLAATNTAHGGPDSIFGGDDDDVAFGGLDADAVNGGGQNDHLEGNHAKDVVHGDGGEDQVVGGGQEIATAGPPKGGRPDDDDQLFGDGGNDLLAGDNAILTVGELVPTPLIADRGFVLGHGVQLLDLRTSAAGTFGDDDIRGGAGNDVLLGQSGEDDLFGEAGDDYAEGNQGKDAIAGGDNEDDLVGGSSTEAGIASGQPDTDDVISGGADGDVVLGDNGLVLRSGTPHPLTVGRGIDSRSISLLDLGDAPTAGTSGGDLVTGDGGNDVVLGQDGPDRLKGNADDDYLEGGQAADWLEGGAADDDLVGGGYTTHPANRSGDTAAGQVDVADVVFGGPGDDVATGDNAQVLRTGVRTKATDRIGTRQAGTRMVARQVTLLDLTTTTGVYTSPSARPVYGADQVSGGDGVDVAWGQDGDDFMSGGAHDDYLQGNGGGDLLRGDAELTAGGHFAAVPPAVIPGLPGAAGDAAERLGVSAPDGQDDLIGGSAAAAFRDGADKIQGDGESDVELGDNGSLVRTLDGAVGSLVERVYSERYPANAVPANATKMRTADGPPTASTRFCVPLPRVTCDVAGTFGNDVMYGDAGDDGMWGQDGDDTMRGGSDRDDMFGELGADVIFGDDGEDAILGDRGGVRNEYLNTDVNRVNVTLNPVPMESYSARAAGRYDRRVDLLHDTNGNLWSGTSTSAAMPHPGLLEGGNDRIRGGAGDDQIHAGWGEDLANGDSGGDEVFGGDGADVLWGGKGCAGAECVGGDAAYRGVGDKFVDHIFGGRGGASEAVGVLGSDILDWAPRPGACTANPWPLDLPNGTSQDPCAWFQMTSTDDGDVTNNQHHHGTDWIYGGWDRDVMQGDVAANGPNPGDRLMDWNGTYNLFTHCNAAYGGFNDIRQHSPSMNTFLQGLAYGAGAGRSLADLTTASTSAFRELALSYAEDTKQHAAGKAFPGTPGHFDQPVACAP